MWSPPSLRRRPRVIPIYCASAATCPKKLMTTPRARREGQGTAPRGHAPKPRPHVTTARALARHTRPLGAEADAQSVRCRPGPGGARAQRNRHLRRRGSRAAAGSRHLSNLPLQPVRLAEADSAPAKRPRSVWHTVGAQYVDWRLCPHPAHKQSGALHRPRHAPFTLPLCCGRRGARSAARVNAPAPAARTGTHPCRPVVPTAGVRTKTRTPSLAPAAAHPIGSGHDERGPQPTAAWTRRMRAQKIEP